MFCLFVLLLLLFLLSKEKRVVCSFIHGFYSYSSLIDRQIRNRVSIGIILFIVFIVFIVCIVSIVSIVSIPSFTLSRLSLSSSSTNMMQDEAPQTTAAERFRSQFDRTVQMYLDRSVPHTHGRWIGFGVALMIYMIRVYFLNGWFIVAYSLGIYLLNLFIGFLTPAIDPEAEGPLLPSQMKDGERIFTRRVPEFKFWWSSMKSIIICTMMTFFKVFDVPVFWPILLIYFCALFFLTMKRQLKHMLKHRYVPWSHGKKSYNGKKEHFKKPMGDSL